MYTFLRDCRCENYLSVDRHFLCVKSMRSKWNTSDHFYYCSYVCMQPHTYIHTHTQSLICNPPKSNSSNIPLTILLQVFTLALFCSIHMLCSWLVQHFNQQPSTHSSFSGVHKLRETTTTRAVASSVRRSRRRWNRINAMHSI